MQVFTTGSENSEEVGSLTDLPRAAKLHSGRSRPNIRKVEDIVTENRQIGIREICRRSQLKYTTVQKILKFDLKLKKRCAKFVPVDLTEAQRERRRAVCDFWCRLQRNNPRVFCHCVTVDESWIYIYDPELKVQSKTWLRQGEPRPQKALRGLGTGKVMIVTFFDVARLIDYEFVQRPLTVNQRVFQAILTRFTEAFHRRRPRSSVNGRHFIHMDNTSPHTATDTLTLLHQLGWSRLPHPAYSPDLALNDFWLYSRIKKNLRGRHYQSLHHLREAVAEEIGGIPSTEYRRCMLESWPKHWRHCLALLGAYFEGMP